MKEKETIIDKLNKLISAAGNAILMNLLFLAACLPVVTIGAAWSALLGAVRFNVRGDKWIDGFKWGFRTRFWRSTITWLIGLPAVLFVMWDLNAAIVMKDTVAMVGSGIMCAFVMMIIHSALTMNVYIYTSVSNWIKNTVNLLFKVPGQLFLSTLMTWLPVAGFLLFFPKDPGLVLLIFELSLVFLCVYFTLAATVTTLALKGGLTETLLECRANGLIIAEEGAQPVHEEEADE